MARTYAGVLGSLAMAIAMLRGALVGAGLVGTIETAITAMIALAGVGLLVGWIAETTIDESVRVQLEKQLAETDEAPA